MTMEERMSEMMRRIEQLGLENQNLYQQVGAMIGQQQAAANGQAARDAGPELVARLESLPAALAEVIARGGGRGGGRSLVDGRGVGKPPVYDNRETSL